MNLIGSIHQRGSLFDSSETTVGSRASGAQTPRRRFWLEATVAVASVATLVVTVAWHDWIEIVFGVDPDDGNGSLEWLVVASIVISGLTSSALARREWGRTQAGPA